VVFVADKGFYERGKITLREELLVDSSYVVLSSSNSIVFI
jgi:hypothetical protein